MNLNSNGFHRSGWISFIVFTLLLPIPTAHADNSTIDYYSNNPFCLKYGINCSSYQLRKDILKPNQTLSDILTAYNVNPTKVHKVAQKAKQIFDVRKMKAGNSFAVMIEPDLKDTARYFIYEKNLIDYVVYNLYDPFDVYQGQKRIETRQNIAAGTVRSSLRKSFMDIGLDTDLLTSLSQIYSWTIDFHHLNKSDHFVIIFEENYVEDKSLGLNKIVAARFNHNGEDYYAFYYKDQGCEEYYDENGQSLQRTFLKTPLRYTKITSRPSASRLHPILKVRRPHLGTDYAAPHGTPIHTIGDGVVQDTGYHKGL